MSHKYIDDKTNEERKRKISEAQKRRWADKTKEERIRDINKLHSNNHSRNTSIELKVQNQLEALGIQYETQVLFFEHFFVDIYIPSMDIAIECNGDYWHNLPNRIERDNRLKNLMDNSEHNLIVLWQHDIVKQDFNIEKYIKEIAI